MLKKFFFFILICGALGALCSCQEQPPTHEHEFGNWKTVKVATCSEEGSMKCECSCGEVETSILEKSPHTLTKTEIAPTCTEQGYTENVCECGYSFKNQQTAPLGHTLTKSITKPTCEREGFSTYTCKCGYTYVAERTAPLGHTLTKTVTEPTCEKEGFSTYACECGYTYAAERTAPLGHTLTKTVTEPTCEKEGFSTYACECGYFFKANYTAPLGHTLTETITAPTCTERGYTFFECSVCDHETYGNYVAPLSHKNSKATIVYPTVKRSGYTLYECLDCEHTYQENYVKYSDIVSGAYVEGSTPLKKGIDTSKYNHRTGATSDDLLPIDWAELKAIGVEFVILKAGSSLGKDAAFEADYAAAKEAGLEVGVYFYAYSPTVSGTVSDALMLLEWLDGKQLDYPVYFDIEDPSLETLGKEHLTELCFTFAEVVQSAGYYCGMYLNNNWLNNILDTEKIIASFDIWYARYGSNEITEWSSEYNWPEYYGTTTGMWQYTQTGVIENFYGEFDFNYSYKDYGELIKGHKLNGFQNN